jgi:hypothetical protein
MAAPHGKLRAKTPRFGLWGRTVTRHTRELKRGCSSTPRRELEGSDPWPTLECAPVASVRAQCWGKWRRQVHASLHSRVSNRGLASWSDGRARRVVPGNCVGVAPHLTQRRWVRSAQVCRPPVCTFADDPSGARKQVRIRRDVGRRSGYRLGYQDVRALSTQQWQPHPAAGSARGFMSRYSPRARRHTPCERLFSLG